MVSLDPNQFDVNHDIPVLDEGEVVVPRENGEETIKITPDFLREVRDNMNRREESTGDLSVLAIGHVKRQNGVDEQSQAPVIGWAKNWSVKPHKNTGKLALHYDEWLRKEFRDVPKKYPRRSPDLWYQTKIIDPIAYLGATTPQRDLGPHPLSMSRNNDTVLRIPYMADESKETKGDAEVKDLLKQVVAGLTELKSEIQALGAGRAPGGLTGEMSPEEAEAELTKLLGGEPEAPKSPKEPEKPVQMAKTDETAAEDLAALKAEIEALKKTNAELVVQMARTELTAKVQAFKDKGVAIEKIEDEVNDLLALPPEMRVRQLARIETSYRRAPGVEVNPALANAIGAQSKVQDVVQHAVKTGKTFEAAYQEINGKLPGVK